VQLPLRCHEPCGNDTKAQVDGDTTGPRHSRAAPASDDGHRSGRPGRSRGTGVRALGREQPPAPVVRSSPHTASRRALATSPGGSREVGSARQPSAPCARQLHYRRPRRIHPSDSLNEGAPSCVDVSSSSVSVWSARSASWVPVPPPLQQADTTTRPRLRATAVVCGGRATDPQPGSATVRSRSNHDRRDPGCGRGPSAFGGTAELGRPRQVPGRHTRIERAAAPA